MRIRKCSTCKRTELETYISRRNKCKECAVEAARAQAERAFDLAEMTYSLGGTDLGSGIARMAAYMQAVHADAVTRHPTWKEPSND